MSKGKMPYGIHCNDNTTLTTHYKNKNFYYIFADKNPDIIFEELKELFIINFGLRSELDIKLYKKQLVTNLKHITENRDNNWKSIRRDSIKNTILIQYVISMKKKHNLTKQITSRLLQDIREYLEIKIITSEDIVIKNGVIIDITNITYKDNNYTISGDAIDKKKDKIKPNIILDKWIKIVSKKDI